MNAEAPFSYSVEAPNYPTDMSESAGVTEAAIPIVDPTRRVM